MKRLSATLLATALAVTSAGVLHAQTDSEKQIERYREMINDPMANPGYLAVDRGEALWSEKRGKNNVSLETCDLGEGPGKIEGAFVKLPRYFADADRVMDLETRLLWCMEKIQGVDTAEIVKRRFSPSNGPATSDMEGLVAFIANKSNGMKYDVKLSHPKEIEARNIGEELFYRRSSLSDFACSTCHASDGLRIRLQGLPNLLESPDTQKTMGSWPTYRVSQSQLRTMQHRLWDCYWQMRMPHVGYTSDATIALTSYLNTLANGGEVQVPSIKR